MSGSHSPVREMDPDLPTGSESSDAPATRSPAKPSAHLVAFASRRVDRRFIGSAVATAGGLIAVLLWRRSRHSTPQQLKLTQLANPLWWHRPVRPITLARRLGALGTPIARP